VRNDDPCEGLAAGPAVELFKRIFGHGVTAPDVRRLCNLAVERHAMRALEAGTPNGYSAVWIAAELRRTGGALTTIELDRERASRARRVFVAAGVSHRIDLRNADAMVELQRLYGPLDSVFLDAGVPVNRRFFEPVRGKLPRWEGLHLAEGRSRR
jgi:predicted O-methyltransferase YrrM